MTRLNLICRILLLIGRLRSRNALSLFTLVYNTGIHSFFERWWCNGQHRCLPSSGSGFDSPPTHSFYKYLLNYTVSCLFSTKYSHKFSYTVQCNCVIYMPISGTRPPGANSPGTPTRMSHPRLPGSNTTVTRARLPGTRPTPPSIDRYANIQFIRFLPLYYHPNTYCIQLEIHNMYHV